MNKTDNIHWTDDPELLEQFALNRTEASARAGLELHLRSCEQCRNAVEAERTLAAGVRMLGRDQLKTRLKHRLEEPAKHIPWPRIMSAAAVIAVIVVVGVYNHWFESQELQQMSADDNLAIRQEEQPVVTQELDRTEGDDVRFKRKLEAGKEAPSAELTPESSPQSLKNRRTGEVRAGVEEIAKSSTEKSEAASRASGDKEAVVLRGAAEPQRDAYREREFAASPALRADASEGIWVEGTLLAESGDYFMEDQPKETGKRDQNELGRAKDESVFNKKALVSKSHIAGGQAPQVSQRPQSSLPATKQKQQKLSSANTVTTLFERTKDGVNMTIFSDIPLHQSDLDNATVEQVTEDSLIVQLAQQKIGYRIPAGWMTQKGAKVETKE